MPAPRLNKQILYRVIFVLIVVFAIASYRFLFYYFTYSRDSYAYANVVNVSTIVPGNISQVLIRDNQHVKKNQPLVVLDQAPFIYAVNQAKAKLATAEVNYKNAANTIEEFTDNVKAKEAAFKIANDHLHRYEILYQKNVISQIVVANTLSQIESRQAELASAKQALATARQNFNTNEIDAEKAALGTAEYNLNQSTIRAPTDGHVTNVYLRKGNYVNSGDFLFALVENDIWWVIARYRETVVRRIHVGDSVHVRFDMYPGKSFHGIVESIGWGINRAESSTQASKSALAYLKPTEDWIQIAQRFPVRIRMIDLPPHYPLRIGATAYTYVHVNSSSNANMAKLDTTR